MQKLHEHSVRILVVYNCVRVACGKARQTAHNIGNVLLPQCTHDCVFGCLCAHSALHHIRSERGRAHTAGLWESVIDAHVPISHCVFGSRCQLCVFGCCWFLFASCFFPVAQIDIRNNVNGGRFVREGERTRTTERERERSHAVCVHFDQNMWRLSHLLLFTQAHGALNERKMMHVKLPFLLIAVFIGLVCLVLAVAARCRSFGFFCVEKVVFDERTTTNNSYTSTGNIFMTFLYAVRAHTHIFLSLVSFFLRFVVFCVFFRFRSTFLRVNRSMCLSIDVNWGVLTSSTPSLIHRLIKVNRCKCLLLILNDKLICTSLDHVFCRRQCSIKLAKTRSAKCSRRIDCPAEYRLLEKCWGKKNEHRNRRAYD